MAVILERLWDSGHAAYVVGGSLRDALLGRPAADWDVATDAPPERIQGLFPGSGYENRFGTVRVPVAVNGPGAATAPETAGVHDAVEVTTFRRDHTYGDHRRPDQVTFGHSLEEDLARRDFTINAIAWGRPATGGEAHWADPWQGREDLQRHLIRAVGEPAKRFDEDALRLLRAVRLAATLGFEIQPHTFAALQASAGLIGYVSRERVGLEFGRLLTAKPPSRGLRLLEAGGLLAARFPLLAAQRGLAQDKIHGDDLWAHSLRTLDAATDMAPHDPTLRLAALLHDVGKPSTLHDGHFPGHDEEGARLATAFLEDLAFPRAEIVVVAALVRHHMFGYTADWSDAAVRRFMRRVGPDLLPRLLLLRRADDLGSGVSPAAGSVDELEVRVAAELERHVPLGLADLAVDGHDLMTALGRPPGPWLGRLLDRLLDSVVADPRRNARDVLLASARAWASELAAEPKAGPIPTSTPDPPPAPTSEEHP
ncbi:MAG TPA: HD domain-containing protein [Candidatus Limnocylindrales bacterium]|nr:HD domain-containing protein [Candidatus Limnocylindrales bacterium]